MTQSDQSNSECVANDLWRNFRIGVGVVTAIVGLSAGYITYGIQMVLAFFAAVFGLLTMSNMGGSPPSMSTDPTAITIVTGVIGFAIFGSAGYRFAINGRDGRILCWIAAIISLPYGIGVFSIWVLRQTVPGTNRVPPNKAMVMAVVAGIAMFTAIYVVPTAITKFNQNKERLERQDTEFIQLVDRQNANELRVLLEQGADPDQTTRLGTTSLMIALENASLHFDTAVLLLEYGADPNIPSRRQKDVIWEDQVQRKQHEDGFIHWLNKSGGADRLTEGNTKHTPLVIAANRGNVDLVELMIEKGADVNAHQAHIEANPFIDHLLERGAGHNTSYSGPKPESSPIATAIDRYLIRRNSDGGDYEGVVRILLSHNAVVDAGVLSRFEAESSIN